MVPCAFCLQIMKVPLSGIEVLFLITIALNIAINAANNVAIKQNSIKNATESHYVVNCSVEQTLRLIVQRQSLMTGFHRELVINVTAEQKNKQVKFFHCFILLKEVFPRDMFVDPYQIQQRPELQKQVLLSQDVDLEKPAQESDPQIVFIFFSASDIISSNDKSNIVTIPFHLRYQKAGDASQKGNYVDVYLPNPTVFGRCKDADSLIERRFLANEVFLGCQHEIVKELCSPQDRQECLWIKFQEIQPSSFLHFQVPRGDLRDLRIVIAATSVIICIGFACLVYAIHGHQRKKFKPKSS